MATAGFSAVVSLRRALSASSLLTLAAAGVVGLSALPAWAVPATYTYTLPSTTLTLDSAADPLFYTIPFKSYLANILPAQAVPAYSRITGLTITGVTVSAANGAFLSDFRIGVAGVSLDSTTGYDFNNTSAVRLSTTNAGGSLNVTGGIDFTQSAQSTPIYTKANSKLGIVAYNARATNLSATPFTGGTLTMSGGSISLTVDADLPKLTPPAPAPVPSAIRLSVPASAQSNTSFAGNLVANGISWYRFAYNGGELSIGTAGSSLRDASATAVADDTHIALYDAKGNLVAENDDINSLAGTYSSALQFGSGDIAKGTYFLAVTGYADLGGFNDFSNGFHASAASSYRGSLALTFDVNGATAPLTGDYNGDGTVDAADYTVWADHFGSTGIDVPGDGNGDDQVDAADYTVWADHFGQTSTPGAIAAIPEPAALSALAALALPMLALRRRR